MRIGYIDGPRFYRAFAAGAEALAAARDEIDRINVFPLADADTGTNMVATVRAAVAQAAVSPELGTTVASMAASAVAGARGNSGLILAQYLYGLGRELTGKARMAGAAFGGPLVRAVRWARQAIGEPVEGTILTVIRDWAHAVETGRRGGDLAQLLPSALEAARASLERTQSQLAALTCAGVVDAGAKGFVTLLEGIERLIERGDGLQQDRLQPVPPPLTEDVVPPNLDGPRFCAEAIVAGSRLEAAELRAMAGAVASSVVIAGGGGVLHLHAHTGDPPALFELLEQVGRIEVPKVDDMWRQYETAHAQSTSIALVTDSTCDLPRELLDEHRIHVVPIPMQVGDSSHLDRLTITPSTFYQRQLEGGRAPTTSQPPVAAFERVFRFVGRYAEHILAIPLASRLSGTCNAARTAAARVGQAVRVVDSRRVSAALGLLVLRAAEAVRSGAAFGDLMPALGSWIPKTHMLVAPKTLDTLWRSGRLHGAKGFVAKLLNVIPVVTIDEAGDLARAGLARFQSGALDVMTHQIQAQVANTEVWGWAVVHAHAPAAAASLAARVERICGVRPRFVEDAAPALGLHAGPGTLGVAVMLR